MDKRYFPVQLADGLQLLSLQGGWKTIWRCFSFHLTSRHTSLILKWSIVHTSPSTNENWSLKCSFIQIVNYSHRRKVQLVCVSLFLSFRCSFHDYSSGGKKEKSRLKERFHVACAVHKILPENLIKNFRLLFWQITIAAGSWWKCISVNSVNMFSCLGFKWSSFFARQNSPPVAFVKHRLWTTRL